MKRIDHSPTYSTTNSDKDRKAKANPFWSWFWLTFLVFSLAYAFYSFYVPSNDIAWSVDINEAQKLATDSDKKIMLFFTGSWCVPCRIMKREVFADHEVTNAINTHIISVMVDVDDPNAKELVSHYKVGTTPITIFTNHQGEVLDYAVGKIGKTQFLEMLKNLQILEF